MNRRVMELGSRFLALGLCAVCALPLHASDPDGERGISVFDKYPECMKPDEMKPADRVKCTVQNGPPRVRVVPNQATRQGNAASGATNADAGVDSGRTIPGRSPASPNGTAPSTR